MSLLPPSAFARLLGTLFLMTSAHAALPPLVPMRDFFRNPEKTGFQLSPDGTHLSFLQPWEGRLNIHVQEIGSEQVTRLTEAKERDIRSYFWASDDRLIYLRDTGGDENFRLFAVDRDGSNPLLLTPFEEIRVRVIDDLENDPDHMIIGHNHRDKRIFDAYRIHIGTGEMEMLVENPGNFSGYLTDHAGKLRVATATDGVNTSLFYRASEDDEFAKILETNFKESLSPLFFTFDNQQLYASSNLGRDKSAIVQFDPATGQETQLLFEHPEVDVSNLIYSRQRQVLTAITYTTDKREYHFLDQERQAIQDFIEARFPEMEVGLTDVSEDETKFLLRTYSDRSLGAYHFLDWETKEVRPLHEIGPWLDSAHLAPMKPVSYPSRDGLTIHGYLTVPVGIEAKNLPVILNVHGGPWARDTWGYDPAVQFLANRGYAVLQMNFRGSTGYGRAFWEASFKEWGRAMQDDVTDGAQWLIEKGLADPERIGIYGASYGGYATLAGLAFTPDLYACGVDYVGVANLLTFMDSIPPYWEPYLEMMYEMVGHPETETEMLRAASPVFHVDQIRAPLFIAQGANDPRVVKNESDQMVAAMRANGVEVPYMVKDNEGHGFANEENRFDFYAAMEKFLARHLGGRIETGNQADLEALRETPVELSLAE
ncbi:MAG: S9 family peptidase [Verrucomicrobiota bacterium]